MTTPSADARTPVPLCPPDPKARPIPLRRRDGSYMWAVVDADDYDAVMAAGPWRALVQPHTAYAKRDVRRADGSRTMQRMHRFLMPDAEVVDHIDGDGLNNRRANLRATTKAGNNRNKRRLRSDNASGVRGVYWDRRGQRWRARYRDGGPKRHIGYFHSLHAAGLAFDLRVMELDPEHYGTSALNNPAVATMPNRPALADVIDALRALPSDATEADALAVVGL